MMSANNIGALAVVDDKSDVVGIISERDYLNKVGVLSKLSFNLWRQICFYSLLFYRSNF